MRCPFCGHRDTRVTDSRANDDGIRRRRHCVACGERFTTLESIQRSTVQVIKKDGRREDFRSEKLAIGLRKACEKRPISVGQIEDIVADIEARVAADSRPEVPSHFIGELAVDALRRLDHIAYIRFASVYRAFSDIESLKEAIAAVEEGRVPTVDERNLQLPLLEDPSMPARPRLVERDETGRKALAQAREVSA